MAIDLHCSFPIYPKFGYKYNMSSLLLLSFSFGSFLYTTGCNGAKTDTDTGTETGETPVPPQWSIIESADTRGAWLRAHIPSDTPETVWMIGGQPEMGAIVTGNHTQGFTTLELPSGTPLLNWGDGTSDNLWVGGLGGTILQWDGNAWHDHSLEIEEAIWGLFVHDDGSVVVVGGSSRWGGDHAVIYEWRNELWTEWALPEEVTSLPNLFKVTHDGSHYWMVGSAGTVLYGENTDIVALPTGITTDIITAIANPQTGVELVGGRGTGIYLQGKNGTLSDTTQLIAGINGISTTISGDTSLVVGEMGYASFRQDSSWTEVTPVTTHILHASATHQLNGAQVWYGVGGNLATADSTFEGSILTMEWSP